MTTQKLDKSRRLRNVMFTEYDMTKLDHLKKVAQLNPQVQYIAFQVEICPQTGKEHIQGYLELYQGMSLNVVKLLLNSSTVHLEPRHGSQRQAIAYVTKNETRKAGEVPFIEGEKKEQGKRNDLENVIKELRDKKTILEVIDKNPDTLPIINALGKYQNLLNNIPRTWKPEVYVLIGAPGTGKTRYVYDNNPIVYDVMEPTSTVWFDGYHGQEVVLFDDFNGNIRYHYLLKLLDRYPMTVNIKGGSTNWCPKKIYITSNHEPCTWYSIPDKGALMRRIDKIMRFPLPDDYTEVST